MKQKINYKYLIINPENYRFDPVDTQEQAIDLMLQEKGTEIYNLARHILTNGLDEAKDFRVLKKPDNKYLVLDGNRRATALKCLHDTSIISDLYLKMLFDALPKNDISPPQDVQVFVYGSESEAAEWIKLDHTGKNEGVGQDPWGAPEKDRFGYKFEGTISPAMQIVELIEKERGTKLNTKKLKISTINRILSNPESRKYLGIDIRKGQLFIIADKEDVINRLIILFDKIINENVAVAEVYNTVLCLEFIQSLFNTYPSFDQAKLFHDEPEEDGNNSKSGDTKKEDSDESSGSRKTPTTRPKKILFGRVLNLKSGDVNNLYTAIKNIYERNCSETEIHALPIIGMSLRLLLDLAARVHYKETNQTSKSEGLKPYKDFLNDAKRTMQKSEIVYLAITNGWLKKGDDIEARLGNYAHYATNYSLNDIINDSKIVGDILEFYFKKK